MASLRSAFINAEGHAIAQAIGAIDGDTPQQCIDRLFDASA